MGYTQIKTKIFEFAYGAGLADATRQKAFKGPESQLRDCESAKKVVREYVDAVLCGTPTNFYKTAKAVEDCFKKHIMVKNIQGRFAFGNAQKLINMTVKYMFAVVYIQEDLRENFKLCHCPMDNYMIDKAIDGIKGYSYRELPERIAKYVTVRGWKGRLRKPWSQIEYDSREQYEIFQEMIEFLSEKQGIRPIEYDYVFWPKG